jgi:hypothetical protein
VAWSPDKLERPGRAWGGGEGLSQGGRDVGVGVDLAAAAGLAVWPRKVAGFEDKKGGQYMRFINNVLHFLWY